MPPQNAKATLSQRTPPPTDFIPDSGDSGGSDFIPDSGGAPASSPTQFEQQRTGGERGAGNAIKRALPGMFARPGESRTDLAGVSGPADALEGKSQQQQAPRWGLGERVKRGWQAGGSDVRSRIGTAASYAVGPYVGMDPQESEHMADIGDEGGIYGQAAVPAATAIGGSLASRVPKAANAVRESAGEFLHDPRTGEAMSPYKAAVERIAPEPTARVADRAQGQAANLNARMNMKAKADAAAEAAKTDVAARQPMPISEGPTAPQHAAVRGAQADVARRNARQFVPTADAPTAPSGVGVPGSAAQEAGYQPPVLRVPTPAGPQPRITPEQIPGPDTAGKGNLLTPAARRGTEGAGAELVRRGRQIVFTQPEYPGTRLQGTLSERMGVPENPNLAQRTAAPTSAPSVTPESGGQMRSSEISPMSPVEKAEIEAQAGRKLTDAEAYAERRRLAEWQSNQALRRGTVDVDPKQSAGLRDTQAKRKR